METKNCSKCNTNKPFCDFYKRGNGYKSHCKKCVGDYYKQYYTENKETHNETMKIHYKNNIESYKSNSKNYRTFNSEKIKSINNEYVKKRRKYDIIFKIKLNLRSRIYSYLKTKKLIKNNTTIQIIGCTPIFFKNYLQEKFYNEMTWENYGEWHIDHIIPLSLAKTEEEIYQLCHYTNLQPLWAEDNLKKSNKIL